MSGEIEFTEEQQKFIGKKIGEARVKAREKATTEAAAAQAAAATEAENTRLATEKEWEKLSNMHQARVAELEPLQTEVDAYRALVDKMLKTKVKTLGDAAKAAVAALPDSLTTREKLDWLSANEALFVSDDNPPEERKKVLGTPAGKEKKKPSTGSSPASVLGKGKKFYA